jgi:hypothetical protein
LPELPFRGDEADMNFRKMNLCKQPLLRLLAVNLAIGVIAAMLMIGGLLVVNPGHIRDLIWHDRSPLLTLGVLLFGFLITFGSAAMGAAIMMLGRDDQPSPRGQARGGEPRLVRISR